MDWKAICRWKTDAVARRVPPGVRSRDGFSTSALATLVNHRANGVLRNAHAFHRWHVERRAALAKGPQREGGTVLPRDAHLAVALGLAQHRGQLPACLGVGLDRHGCSLWSKSGLGRTLALCHPDQNCSLYVIPTGAEDEAEGSGQASAADACLGGGGKLCNLRPPRSPARGLPPSGQVSPDYAWDNGRCRLPLGLDNARQQRPDRREEVLLGCALERRKSF